MDRYAVIGHPISHSLSPRIHTAFAEQTGQALTYTAIDVPADRFGDDAGAFFAAGGKGLNVTMPHKHNALLFCDEVSDAARLAGAVNTITRLDNGDYIGATTDGGGLLRDLTDNLGQAVVARQVLLLGAGGSAIAALTALLDAGVGCVTIANRTAARARAAARSAGQPDRVDGCGLDEIGGRAFDLVINATAASLAGMPPAIAPRCVRGAVCYDLMYAAGGTAFTDWAASHGAASVHTGIGMLAEQAADSFAIWRGVRPDTKPVLALLARELGLTF